MEEVFDVVDEATLLEACTRAVEKLRRIIDREGDADGARLEPAYIQQLIAEQITEIRAAEIYNKKRSVANANAPIQLFYCSRQRLICQGGDV